jgi:two-component system LytT family response regulator
MLRTIIIDDEANIRSLLKEILLHRCPDVEVVAETGSISASLEAIQRLNPDLVLLDILLEDGTGFELLEKLGSPGFRLIFITASEDYALKAFRLCAVDYIVKPIDPEQLVEAIAKARTVISNGNENPIRVLMSNRNNPGGQEKKIVLRTADKFHFVSVGDIVRCESDSSYTTFFLTDSSSIVISKTLKEFEELLNEFGFYRPHKSFLINLKCIKAFEKSDGGFIIMTDESKVPLSDKKREEFFRIMEHL